MRADAQRNYDLLLTAAKDVFGEHGVDAPLDDIARRAGVGNATLYRHFPTRRELIIAVYADEVTDLTRTGATLLERADPLAGLIAWLRAFVEHVADKGGLAVAINDDAERSELFDGWHAAMLQTTTALLQRAQNAGAIRTGITAADLLVLARGLAVSGADRRRTQRLLGIVRDGIAAQT